MQVQLENMETSYKCFVSAVSVNVRYLLNPKTLANHDVSLFDNMSHAPSSLVVWNILATLALRRRGGCKSLE